MARQTGAPRPTRTRLHSVGEWTVRAVRDDANPERREIVGTATTDSLDRYNTRIHPAAIERAIPGFMANPVMLYQHDTDQSIGTWETLERAGDSIVARGVLLPESAHDELADFVWTRIEHGVVRSLSIGFDADFQRDGAKDKDGTYWWGKPDGSGTIDLMDLSVVVIPGNKDATDLAVSRGFDGSRPWELPNMHYEAWGTLSARDVEQAIGKALNGDAQEWEWWVVELYETYTIVRNWREDKAYRIEYAVVSGAVVLGERVEVAMTWQPVETTHTEQAAPEPLQRRAIESDLPIAPEDTEWDATAAESRVREWAGGDETDWGRYSRAFLWVADDEEQYDAYKLPIADVIDGELRAVWRGIAAATAAMAGARGGVDIPDEDRAAVIATLKAYYKQLDKPWPENLGAEPCSYRDVTWQADEPAIYEEQRVLQDIQTILAVRGTLEGIRNICRHWAGQRRGLSPDRLASLRSAVDAIAELADELCSPQTHVDEPSAEDRLRRAFAATYLGSEDRAA